MIDLIDDCREVRGVEPICRVLPIPPSTYRAQVARLPARAQRDVALMPEIARVFEAHFRVHGADELADIEPFGGSVGDSYDNALAASINGLCKTEVIRRRGPRRALEAVEVATLEWVDWPTHRRLLEAIGNIPPAGALSCAAQEKLLLAACLKPNSLRQTRGGSKQNSRPRFALDQTRISRRAPCWFMIGVVPFFPRRT